MGQSDVCTERATRVNPRVSFPYFSTSYCVGNQIPEDITVLEQIFTSLENHCYCALDSSWLDKLVKEGRDGGKEHRELVRRVREKWSEAGEPGGLFIIRACEMGLCREIGKVGK